MSDIAIRVEHLGKQYQLGGQQASYSTFRETLVSMAKMPLQWLKGEYKTEQNSFWALDDVSFEVMHGEAVGIIGRNGAGKSTLLKILSRITSPTCGRVDTFGRVGSLLEVGVGFHPELSGRENIYLNGAILGMSRKEIMRKFDEIVTFAEIEQFLDTPVKHYSSGMYVRLAFSVAAHLEPEILVVDEVLAVGDAEFQKKCLGKMGDVAQEGRTVLFVSHNLGAIGNLCNKSLLLVNGRRALFESTKMVINKYLNIDHSDAKGLWINDNEEKREISIQEVSVRNGLNAVSSKIANESPFKVRVVLDARKNNIQAQIHIRVTNQAGIPVFTISNTDNCNNYDGIRKGRSTYDVTIPGNFLVPGNYTAIIAVLNPNITIFDKVEDISFIIEDIGNYGTIRQDNRLGVVTPLFEWEFINGNAE